MYNSIVVINSDTLGRGNEDVGATLLATFLRKVLASMNKPDAIVFYNSGVKLLTRGSYYLEVLEALEESGVELLACGTCVYNVCGKHGLRVGRISNMDEIATALLNCQKVITL